MMVAALAAASGCRGERVDGLAVDSTALVPAPIRALAGTYELSTTMTKFTYETGPIGYADCPNQASLYCTHVRAPLDSAMLAGTIVLSSPTDSVPFFSTSATLTGRFCDSIDPKTSLGCVHVGPPTVQVYSGGGISVAKSFPTPSDVSGTMRVPDPDDLGAHVDFIEAHADADSIYGTLLWELTVNRSPPTYYANFVMHRVH